MGMGMERKEEGKCEAKFTEGDLYTWVTKC